MSKIHAIKDAKVTVWLERMDSAYLIRRSLFTLDGADGLTIDVSTCASNEIIFDIKRDGKPDEIQMLKLEDVAMALTGTPDAKVVGP